MSASKVVLDGTMLTFTPPLMVPMLSVTLSTILPAPGPMARSMVARPASIAARTLSEIWGLISPSFSVSTAIAIAVLVALLLACV